jgi:Spy/CpxP family protein refolding chaperone
MTEQPSSAPSTGSENPASRPRSRRWLLGATTALAAALAGAVGAHAFGGHGFGHHGGFMGGAFDPAQAEDRVDRMMRHLAVEVDATAEQQEKLRALAKAAVKDLAPMREKVVAARQRAPALLTRPTVDRTAIEAFRAEQMALADAASRRIAQALADAAETLTPDQRRKLEDRLTGRRGYWRGWHRG